MSYCWFCLLLVMIVLKYSIVVDDELVVIVVVVFIVEDGVEIGVWIVIIDFIGSLIILVFFVVF